MKNKKFILMVTLNPAIDKTIKIKAFKVGEDFREKGINLSAGGKGINVSRIIKTLGGKTIATGLLGGMGGSFIEKQICKEEIKNDFSKISDETRTNLTIINPAKKEITRILERGPVISNNEIKAFKKKYYQLLRKSDYVIFSGSLPRGLNFAIYNELIRIVKKYGIKTVLDTSGRALLKGLKAKPDIIKPNLSEAEQIMKERLNSMSKVKNAVKYFLNKGIEKVIITMGNKGAVGSNGRETYLVIPPKINCKNNVGCGDALIGGFVFSLSIGKSFKDSLQLAVATGAANALNIKPGFCKKKDITNLVGKVKVKRIN
jgi:1-phosphofructokinase family hexose kinase